MSAKRKPGDVPNSFVYRSYETVLSKLLHKAGAVLDFHGQYKNDFPEIVDQAESQWGLHSLGYTYGYHSGGSHNWYLPDADAFINFYPSGRNSGSLTVMMDDDNNDSQNLFFRLLHGTVIPCREIGSDIPGCAVAYIAYSNKAEFLAALRKADVLVRDNASNQAIYALALLNTPTVRSRCP